MVSQPPAEVDLVNHPAWDEWDESCRLRGSMLRKILQEGCLVAHMADALRQLRQYRAHSKRWLAYRLTNDPMSPIKVTEWPK